jgi:hypothetical protein
MTEAVGNSVFWDITPSYSVKVKLCLLTASYCFLSLNFILEHEGVHFDFFWTVRHYRPSCRTFECKFIYSYFSC